MPAPPFSHGSGGVIRQGHSSAVNSIRHGALTLSTARLLPCICTPCRAGAAQAANFINPASPLHPRYTAFIPLYPVGVVCEMALLYQALPFLEKRDMYSLHMPNRLNHAFDYHIFAKARSGLA